MAKANLRNYHTLRQASHALAQRLRPSLIKSNSDNFHDMNEEMVDVAAQREQDELPRVTGCVTAE